MKSSPLIITNLSVRIGQKSILKKVSLTIPAGKITALMGPNGSGKSTLAATLAGHPDYHVTSGTARWQGKNLLSLPAWERARLGLFLAWQRPVALPGVTFEEFLWTAAVAGDSRLTRDEFLARCADALNQLKLAPDFLTRAVNDGWSGGEQKKGELVQLLVLRPKLAILDETDSGLDVDAIRLVAKTVSGAVAKHGLTVILITHYHRLLDLLKPQRVIVLSGGRVAASGTTAVMNKIQRQGYDWLKQ